jgi:hypothetical protein
MRDEKQQLDDLRRSQCLVEKDDAGTVSSGVDVRFKESWKSRAIERDQNTFMCRCPNEQIRVTDSGGRAIRVTDSHDVEGKPTDALMLRDSCPNGAAAQILIEQ